MSLNQSVFKLNESLKWIEFRLRIRKIVVIPEHLCLVLYFLRRQTFHCYLGEAFGEAWVPEIGVLFAQYFFIELPDFFYQTLPLTSKINSHKTGELLRVVTARLDGAVSPTAHLCVCLIRLLRFYLAFDSDPI